MRTGSSRSHLARRVDRSRRRSRGRNPAGDRRPFAEDAPDLERSTERVEAIGHPLQAGPITGRAGIESVAVVGDVEYQAAVELGQRDGGPRRVRVLRDVLKGLETAEVD